MSFNKNKSYNIIISIIVCILLYQAHQYIQYIYYKHCAGNLFQVMFMSNSKYCYMIKKINTRIEDIFYNAFNSNI